MKNIALAGAGIIGTAVGFAPHAVADSGAYVDIPTASGCTVTADEVMCLRTSHFSDPAHQVAVLTPAGTLTWTQGTSLGGPAHGMALVDLVPGQTDHRSGWTVVTTSDATTFTNDTSGRGMTVGVTDAT